MKPLNPIITVGLAVGGIFTAMVTKIIVDTQEKEAEVAHTYATTGSLTEISPKTAKQWKEQTLTPKNYLRQNEAAICIEDKPEVWQRFGIERNQAQILELDISTTHGADVEQMLQSPAKFFAVPQDDGRIIVIPRETLESAFRAAAFAAEECHLPRIPQVVLSGSMENNAFAGNSSNQIIICVGRFLRQNNGSPLTLQHLVATVAHEIGHLTDLHRKGYFAYQKQTFYKAEQSADSLGICAAGDFVGAAKALFREIINSGGDYPRSDDIPPPLKERIEMAVRLFAKDRTLTHEQRAAQYRELVEFNDGLSDEWKTLKVTPVDLVKYYHQEYAKAHPELNRTSAMEQKTTDFKALAQKASLGIRGVTAKDIQAGINPAAISASDKNRTKHFQRT